MLAMFYCTLVTPYELGVMRASEPSEALLVTNTAVDVIFTFDLILQFFLGFEDHKKTIYSPALIARRCALWRARTKSVDLLTFPPRRSRRPEEMVLARLCVGVALSIGQ